MRSPTSALLWEIWRPNRLVVAAIATLTIAGWFIASSVTVDLLWMLALLLLFGVFKHSFPRRHFTLPVSTLRLVTVPLVAGVVAIVTLYLLRMRSTSLPFVAVLFGASMVFYQAILWTLEGLGVLRLVIVGAMALALFTIRLLPPWLSEGTLTALVAVAAIAAFLLAWRHVSNLRHGGARSSRPLERLIAAIPARRKPFASPVAAHFWFEWRSSGVVLPTLIAALIVVVIAPVSWLVRYDPIDTFRLLVATLAAPVVLAIPIGMAFGKPAFWSEDLSVPAFIAVRPLTDEDLVAIKVKVAMASAGLSWLLVLTFAGLFLPLSRITAPIVVAAILLTWRFLISGLWSGVSGKRALFIADAMSIVIVIIAAVAFDADRFPAWLLGDPARMEAAVWILAFAVAVKAALGAFSWRRVSARQYLFVWTAATALLVWAALDIERFRSPMLLIALLAIPLARVGLAPRLLARNRHRS